MIGGVRNHPSHLLVEEEVAIGGPKISALYMTYQPSLIRITSFRFIVQILITFISHGDFIR